MKTADLCPPSVNSLNSVDRLNLIYLCKLKADRPDLRDYPHMPTDYGRTDRRTDGRTLPSTLSPSFVVDNDGRIHMGFSAMGLEHDENAHQVLSIKVLNFWILKPMGKTL